MERKTINKVQINRELEGMKQLQADTGSHDDYGQGLYNGLELARVVLLEDETSKFVGLKEWKKMKK